MKGGNLKGKIICTKKEQHKTVKREKDCCYRRLQGAKEMRFRVL